MNTESDHHILEYKTLFYVLLILFGLTGITVGASYIDLGKLNVLHGEML